MDSSPNESLDNSTVCTATPPPTIKATPHWGEIVEDEFEIIPNVIDDIECAMRNTCLDDLSDDEETEDDEKKLPELIEEDPLINYGIALHRYCRKLESLIETAEKAIKDGKEMKAEAPPMPDVPNEWKLYSENQQFIPKVESDVKGLNFSSTLSPDIEIEPPKISGIAAKKTLSHSVAVLLAHAGFTKTEESAFNLLIDVFEEFLRKISYQMRCASDDAENGEFPFPNIIEKVLIDTGMGGVAGLQDYYQTRVVKYIFTLQKRCNALLEQYQQILLPKPQQSTTAEINMEQETIHVNSEDSAVIHLASGDDLGLSSLAPGFQLLNSLEASGIAASLAEFQ